ncbi:MAG: MFS transporter [Anaerolineales bacterium]|nr:MFS transporter [Anaerolineales bacterium]
MKSYAWIILGVVYLASLTAAISLYKAPPLMPVLMREFHLSLGSAGALMSLFSFAGVLLALPAAVMFQRWGAKATMLMAIGAVISGGALGALTQSATTLMLSRAIEGLGMGVVAVASPAALASWFAPNKRGTALGIWSTWMPMGSIIMSLLAPRLEARLGWGSVWWAGTLFAGGVFILFVILFRMPIDYEPPGRVEAYQIVEALRNRDVLLISLAMCCFTSVFLAYNTYLPTFLNLERGFTLAQASLIASLAMMTNIFSGPLGGELSDRVGTRKWVAVVGLVVLAGLTQLSFRVTGWTIPVLGLLVGVCTGPIGAAYIAAVSEATTRPQMISLNMAVLTVGGNLGTFIGPLAFGAVAQATSWIAAGSLMLMACLLSALAGWATRIR